MSTVWTLQVLSSIGFGPTKHSLLPQLLFHMGSPKGKVLAFFFSLYLLPLFSVFWKTWYFISLLCWWLPDLHSDFHLAQNNIIQQLTHCLNDIKAHPFLSFPRLSEKKTEVVLFRLSCCHFPRVDLGSLSPYLRDCVTNLGVKFDLESLKQINSVVQKVFIIFAK